MKITTIIGVPGAGKTTYLSRLYFEHGWDIYSNTLVTGLTNATIKAFLSKIGLDYKQYGARTVYGLAFMELYRLGLLQDHEVKKLSSNFKKEYIQQFKVKYGYNMTYRKLEIINQIFLKSILRYKTSKHWEEFKIDLEIHKIPLWVAKQIYDDYKSGNYFDYVFLLERALHEDLNFFNIYQMRLKSDTVEKIVPERIVIDEFQDFPAILFKKVLECENVKELYLAGDPAQEIFSFLETDVDFILKYTHAKDYLTQTYRFGEAISNLANRLLQEMGYEYKIKPHNIKSKVFRFKFNWSDFLSILYKTYRKLNEIAILTRTRAQAYDIFNKLKERNYPVINLEKFEYEKIQLIMDTIRNLKKLKPEKGEGIRFYIKTEKEKLIEILQREGLSPEYIKLALQLLHAKKKIFVSTIHNVKGLEFESVFLINDLPDLILKMLYSNNNKYLEELKVFYTGITRAKKLLVIWDGDRSFI